MIKRLQGLSGRHSCFLFGARATGKSTLLAQKAPPHRSDVLWIDLLSFEQETRWSQDPDLLSRMLQQKPYKMVVIDEVQKVPKLLDIVHREYEKNKKLRFFVTGSSARKLKRGQANLLAGRLFLFHLHPFTHIELGKKFLLDEALSYGTLPGVWTCQSVADRCRYLKSYVQAYLQEEILVEQLVRKIAPFKNFMPIAAQYSGQKINFLNIAKNIGVDASTVQSYFDILCDTYLGFYLPSFHRSVCKQQAKAAKFYLFDTGVLRALAQQLSAPVLPQTYEYGRLFEHLVILESIRLNDYFETDYKFSYVQDRGSREVDLVIQPPRGPELLIEIKSTRHVEGKQAKNLEKFLNLWDKPAKAQLWSQDPYPQQHGRVQFLHWQEGLKQLF